ncbi:MAG: hypothetical protein LUG93_05060 [Lachnospiraceae bacterium]|nr:hypothetical protein [Lachnospiraceae bacterium]
MKKIAVLICVVAIFASVYAERAEASVMVEPLGAGLDLEWLQESGDAEFAAAFSASDFYTEEDGTCMVSVSVYEREYFDMVAVGLLQAGDTIILDGTPVIIKTLECIEDGSVIINGGFDSNDGHVLQTDEDTLYYEVDVIGAWNYQLTGEAAFRLDDDFIVKDYADSSDPGAEYGAEDFFGEQSTDLSDLNFGYENTTVTVENGLVTEIVREASSETEAENTALGSGEAPYTVRISRNDLPVFEGPGYDYNYVSTIVTAGTYTIEEEEEDFEGYLWGRLKSGAGWIDLAEAVSDNSDVPITAAFDSEQIQDNGDYVEYIADDSENPMTTIAFRPNENLKNVSFSLLGINEDGNWIQEEERYTISDLSADSCFVAAVCFYGDMTAYGISFTDEEGQERHFAVHISGRNGSLILDEYDTAL